MSLLSVENLSKKYNKQILFDNLSFTILPGDKIGLVGKNGSGKTTLFDIISKLNEADSGIVNQSRQCLINYTEQEKLEYLDFTLFEYIASARDDLLLMRKKIVELEEELSRTPDDPRALEQLGQHQIEYEHAGGFNFETEIKTILTGLGFEDHRYTDRMANFSGGEKNRAALAKILAGNGNLLLLDEPTNHLDIVSTQWLEEYLAKTDKSFIVVSHDRMFLNNTVNKVWEIIGGKVEFYVGTFEKYLFERSERKRLHAHHYRHQQDRIKQLEDFIRRHMAGQKTKQAQSKQKYLNRLKKIPPPKSDGSGPMIEVKSSGRSYAHVLEVANVTTGYGDTPVVYDLKFDIYRGDKIGLIGENGSGKSTILKSLIGELDPIEGEIRIGNNVDVSYFDQELSDLNMDNTVLENLWEIDPNVEVGVIRSFLGRFGFSGDDAIKKVSTLSGGEKTKLSLARLLYFPSNLIIFDEPTNHLDIVSREALEQALNNYDGSLLIVSHDRYFLDKVVDKIFYLKNGRIQIFNGNYSYFKEKILDYQPTIVTKDTKSKQSYMEFKEKSKQRTKLKKEIEKTKETIAELEKEVIALAEALNGQIPADDWEQLQKITEKKHQTEEEILELYLKLEELEAVELD